MVERPIKLPKYNLVRIQGVVKRIVGRLAHGTLALGSLALGSLALGTLVLVYDVSRNIRKLVLLLCKIIFGWVYYFTEILFVPNPIYFTHVELARANLGTSYFYR